MDRIGQVYIDLGRELRELEKLLDQPFTHIAGIWSDEDWQTVFRTVVLVTTGLAPIYSTVSKITRIALGINWNST